MMRITLRLDSGLRRNDEKGRNDEITSWLAGLTLALTAAACAPAGTRAPATPQPVNAPVATPSITSEIPTPEFYREAIASGTRSASGAPGAAYWQNRVSYQIEAELDPADALIRGTARIVYRNNSPMALPSILLNLYQNIFTESVPRNRYAPVTGGITLERVAAQGQQLTRRLTSALPIATERAGAQAGFSVQGTLGRIRLPQAVAPGDSVVLEIDWQHRIPPSTGFRTAWEEALGGRAFLVAQWYPQVAVYDDLHGWDVTPYLGDGEFYLEYGDFNVAITVPTGYLVGATGDLANPDEVLTDEARRRLAAAARSDSITRVVTAADLTAENATPQALGGQLTWHFEARNVRDFAFATSDHYVWDATRTQVAAAGAGSRTVLVHSLYRPGAPNWEEAAGYAQRATAFIGEVVVPYPYSQITVAEGPIGGMEYPMLTFIGRPAAEEDLYAVIAHEIAHEWFPMLVGQNEAAYAWMDEGLATYLEALAMGDFANLPDPHLSNLDGYLTVAGSDLEVPLMRHTDLVNPYGNRVVAAYFKPGFLFRSLGALIADEQFWEALQSYTQAWANKHPTPWDFFSAMEASAGVDLDWFFEPFWFETDVLDNGITAVDRTAAGPTVVTIGRVGEAIAPAVIIGTTASGGRVVGAVPVGTWLTGVRTATVSLISAEPIVRFELDPGHLFPDVNPANDVWPADSPAPAP